MILNHRAGVTAIANERRLAICRSEGRRENFAGYGCLGTATAGMGPRRGSRGWSSVPLGEAVDVPGLGADWNCTGESPRGRAAEGVSPLT